LTEIPEHLLQRSRERRAALGLGGDAPAAGSAGEAASTPEPAAAAPVPAESGGGGVAKPPTPAPPAEAKPEPPKPDPVYVQAAKQRRRIPLWATPVLAAIPLWAYVFYGTLSPAPVENDPLVLGEELYTQCAACHGGSGQGLTAPQLSDGKVQETWPDPLDHIMWVKLGAKEWPSDSYGAQGKSKEDTPGDMPGYAATLTDQEIAQVVLYERRVLSDEEPPEGEEDKLLLVAEGEMTLDEAELGELSAEAGVPESELAG
jgi:mono/diheme cytochrome c family protein